MSCKSFFYPPSIFNWLLIIFSLSSFSTLHRPTVNIQNPSLYQSQSLKCNAFEHENSLSMLLTWLKNLEFIPIFTKNYRSELWILGLTSTTKRTGGWFSPSRQICKKGAFLMFFVSYSVFIAMLVEEECGFCEVEDNECCFSFKVIWFAWWASSEKGIEVREGWGSLEKEQSIKGERFTDNI